MTNSILFKAESLESPEFKAILEKHDDWLPLFFNLQVMITGLTLKLRDDVELDEEAFKKISEFIYEATLIVHLSVKEHFNLKMGQLNGILEELHPYVLQCMTNEETGEHPESSIKFVYTNLDEVDEPVK